MSAITPHQAISIKLTELDQALKSAHPTMPALLQQIHRALSNDAETTTLLTSEEVAILVRGLSKQVDAVIQTSMLSGGKGKSLKKMTADDV